MDLPLRVAAAGPVGPVNPLGPEGPKTLQGLQESPGGLAQGAQRPDKATAVLGPLGGVPSGVQAPGNLPSQSPKEKEICAPQ